MAARNLLILCSDEHARAALGCYGHPFAQTPALDRLATRGTRLTRAYTPSPICVSARACLATGTAVHENRCWSSAQPYHGQQESWMHRLRDAGQTVVSIGKLHFRSSADDNGFSEEILPMHLADGGRGWLLGLLRNPLPDYPGAAELAQGVGPGESDYTAYDRRITETACRWLRQHAKGPSATPWALFVSFVSPHYPLIAPQDFYDLYRDEDMPGAAPASERPDHPLLREMAAFWCYDSYFDADSRIRAQRAYFGLCSFLDHNIGQVLAALEDAGAASDTTVLYLSDHGEMLGRRGFWTKSVMYEDSVAIPLLISGRGIGRGRNDTPVSLTDIAATALENSGLPGRDSPAAWQGRPLQTFIRSPEPERPLLSQYHDGGCPTGIFMLRQGRWKYLHYAGGYPDQLFDMEADPQELRDLGGQPPLADVQAELRAALGAILDPETVDAQAFRDQAEMIEAYGGAEAILARPSFNHTPVAG